MNQYINKYHFPIDKTKIPKHFLKQFEFKNLHFVVDEFEQLIVNDILQFNQDLGIKMNRDLTSMFIDWIDTKLKNKENISIGIKGSTRSGKSLIGLKISEILSKINNKPFNTNYIICGNQNEYRLKLSKAQFGDTFQIDENAFSQVGDGANTERSQLLDVQNIIAKQNINNIYITPKQFLNNNCAYGLSFNGKDVNNWASKFLLYKLGGFDPVLLGYIIVNVGVLFNDYGCFFNKILGGCTNPKRLDLIDIDKDNLIFNDVSDKKNIIKKKISIDYYNHSSCIPKDKTFNQIKESLTSKDKSQIPCPFYRICKHPLKEYEIKKDKWIDEEMTGGMGARQNERFRIALEILFKLGEYDDKEHKLKLKAFSKDNAHIKIKLLLPDITNTKLNKTEFIEVFNIIKSLNEIEVFKQICKNLKYDWKEKILLIDNGQTLINTLNSI